MVVVNVVVVVVKVEEEAYEEEEKEKEKKEEVVEGEEQESPAGMPEDANETTSREVKSGRVKESFSKSSDHGSILIKSVA